MAFEQSRKDDLIAIGYVLIYFANNGQLPWIHCETNAKAIKLKANLDLDRLFKGKNEEV